MATSPRAQPGLFIAAYSHDADMLWRRRLSEQPFDELTAVRALPDGSVLWAGTTTAPLGDAAFGGSDVVVGSFDAATGKSKWVTELGTAMDDRAVDVAIDVHGNIHVAGGVANADLSDRDVFLMTLDATGTVIKTQEWGSTGIDLASAVAVDPCGTAVVVGATSGDFGGAHQGMRDGFLVIAR